MRTFAVVALALMLSAPAGAQEEDPQDDDPGSYEPDPSPPAAVTAPSPLPRPAPYGYAPPCGCCPQPRCTPKQMAVRSDLFPPVLVQPEKERPRNSAAHGAMIAGTALLVFGEVLNAFYLFNRPTTLGLVTLLPIVGPATAVFHDRPGPDWATPLLLSTWVQAAGVLMMGVAAGYNDDDEQPAETQRVHVSAGTATGRDGHVSVSVRF
jgi:hypothetical protein